MDENRFIRSLLSRQSKENFVAAKGYIGKKLLEFLFMNGIQFGAKVNNNIKNSFMSLSGKIMLRKRSLVESVNDELMNISQIAPSRHRSFANLSPMF